MSQTAATIDVSLKAEYKAWELIGFDGSIALVPSSDGSERPFWDENYDQIDYPRASVRIKGGRALYECVSNRDGSLDARCQVELSRFETRDRGVHGVIRLVDEDTLIEVIMDPEASPDD
jgi:hypothetical protein